jgi:hypothetical protein
VLIETGQGHMTSPEKGTNLQFELEACVTTGTRYVSALVSWVWGRHGEDWVGRWRDL